MLWADNTLLNVIEYWKSWTMKIVIRFGKKMKEKNKKNKNGISTI